MPIVSSHLTDIVLALNRSSIL